MAGIVILCVIGLLLGLILFTPLLVRVIREEEGLLVRLHIGPAKLRLYPPKAEEPAAETPPEKEKKKTEPKEKPRKERKPITMEQVLYLLEQAPPILSRALSRVRRRVRVGPLKVWLLLSAADPADTGLLYGRVEAALMAALPILHRCLRIRDQDIQIYPDFTGQGMDYQLDVGLSLRLWDLLVIGLCAGAGGLKLLVGMRRLAPKGPGERAKSEKTNQSTTNGVDAA